MASSIQCGPCVHESTNKNAEKWCSDCNEGFCNLCEKAHKSMKISRDHSLIPIEDYRKIEHVNVRFECIEHGSKLEMYCKIHEMAICIACFPGKHNNCSNEIIPLAEAAKNAKTSTALSDLEHTITNTLESIKECRIDRAAASQRIETQEKNIKKRISDTRETINKHLDELERKLLNELSIKYTSCKSKDGKVQSQINKTEKDIKRLKEQTSQLKRFASDLHVFLSTHQVNKEVHDEVRVLQEAVRSVKNYNIEIEIHEGITSLLNDVNLFGRIRVDESTTNFKFMDANIDQAQKHVQPRRYVKDTSLQLRKKFEIKKNGNTMYISGCELLANGNLLIADNTGHNILMEYNEEGHCIRDIPVGANPYDLTVIDTDHIAVSYSPLNYIEFIDLKKTKVLKKVEFENPSRGISYSDGKIYSVVKNEGIVVLDMDGTLLNTIHCDKRVYNITTTNNRIYYTHMLNSTVYCCTTTGEIIWEFQKATLNKPGGIAVDRYQNAFVVGHHSSNLLMLQDDGKVIKTLLTAADGLEDPTRVCYNKELNLLLVCNRKNGNAFVFSIN